MPVTKTDTQRVRFPDPAIFAENQILYQYLFELSDAINSIPPLSTFSFNTPESNVTARTGTLGVNLASATTLLWYKQTGAGNTGWDSLATSRSA